MITTEDFTRYNGSDRGGGEIVGFPALTAFNNMVDQFSKAMKDKFKKKYLEGKGGWDNTEWKGFIQSELRRHITKATLEGDTNQYIDIANLAAMLWNMEQ